ncbi:MAG: double zinc ribbon domain-containing protein [Burkholderiales bacterium]
MPLSISCGRLIDRCVRKWQRALPAHCVLCGAASPPERLCIPCDAALPRLPARRCAVCALPLPSGEVCGACITHPPKFDTVTAAFAYAFPIDALIRKYKYGAGLTFAPVLAALLARTPCPDVDALIPMPLAPGRLRERGFNQAQEMARIAGGLRRMPVLARACRKVSETPPQAALPWDARARNVRGTFVCDADMAGRRVAVVDDVMTTGATVNELSRVLKRAGAQSVHVWVLARTLRESSRVNER